MTLQFLVAMIAASVNDRLQRKLEYVLEESIGTLTAVDALGQVDVGLEGLVRNLEDDDGAGRTVTLAQLAADAVLGDERDATAELVGQ